MAGKEIGFRAKRDIPASEIDVTSHRVVVTPPTEDGNGDEVLATINFGIQGVSPIEITSDEMDIFWKWAIPIAGRAPNLRQIVPETAKAAALR